MQQRHPPATERQSLALSKYPWPVQKAAASLFPETTWRGLRLPLRT
jgi:hypothetical protein